MRWLICATMALAGCSHTAWQIGAGLPPPDAAAQVHVSSSSLATVFGIALLAGSVYEAARYGVDYPGTARTPPEMAPDRKVSEQDCTKPLDYSLGNIRCK